LKKWVAILLENEILGFFALFENKRLKASFDGPYGGLSEK